jgi:hypothetical protein
MNSLRFIMVLLAILAPGGSAAGSPVDIERVVVTPTIATAMVSPARRQSLG